MGRLDFFDCNCMLGEQTIPRPYAEYGKEGLLEKMDYYGIKEALVLHSRARSYSAAEGNRILLEMLEGEKRLHPCLVFNLHNEVEIDNPNEYVADAVRKGVKGFSVFPPIAHPYCVEDWAVGPMFKALEKHRLPVILEQSDLSFFTRFPDDLTSSGWSGFSPENIYKLCKTYPLIPFIIGRFHFFSTRIGVPLLRQLHNLYADISYYSTHRGIEFLSQKVGASRLVFGTSYPFHNPAVPLGLVTYADVTEAERESIAQGNLRKLVRGVR
jgi:predicted TIM-barrel fold metal-dependent hydrolase